MSAVDFDMNKYFQIMWIAAALLAAWWLARRPTWLVVAVLAFSAISPALIAVHHATHPAVVMSGAQLAAARWIETHTPERTVFATDDFINSPVDLAGRLRITTFGPYVANLGYDPEPRAADTRSIYCDGAGRRARPAGRLWRHLRPVAGRGPRLRGRPDRLRGQRPLRDGLCH